MTDIFFWFLGVNKMKKVVNFQCHPFVDVEKYIEMCVSDICSDSDFDDYICEVADQYAR